MNEEGYPYIDLSFKVGKAYKHKFLVLTRDETEDIIPILPYETECDIILDNIRAKIRLNVVLRLIITSGNDELISYLKELSESDPNQRKNVKLLLNKNFELVDKFNVDNHDLESTNNELKEIINYLDHENYVLWKKVNRINYFFEKFDNLNLTKEDVLLIEDEDLRNKFIFLLEQLDYLNK